jgi:hypothetical protein
MWGWRRSISSMLGRVPAGADAEQQTPAGELVDRDRHPQLHSRLIGRER